MRLWYYGPQFLLTYLDQKFESYPFCQNVAISDHIFTQPKSFFGQPHPQVVPVILGAYRIYINM